jgi:uncharacterized protein involved in exopolysaccharide biosynthesis
LGTDFGQVGELVQAFLRVKPCLKWVLALSLIVGVGAGVYYRLARNPAYVSEAIAMVRPQQPLEVDQEANGARKTGHWSMLPKPLSVNDYVFLLKSDSVLGAVAAAYSTYHPQADASEELNITQLNHMLQAESRLELKTPYTVSYHPTVKLSVTAGSREMAHELATAWLSVATERTHQVTFAAK